MIQFELGLQEVLAGMSTYDQSDFMTIPLAEVDIMALHDATISKIKQFVGDEKYEN